MMYYASSQPDAPNISKDEPYWMKNGEIVANSAKLASNAIPPFSWSLPPKKSYQRLFLFNVWKLLSSSQAKVGSYSPDIAPSHQKHRQSVGLATINPNLEFLWI